MHKHAPADSLEPLSLSLMAQSALVRVAGVAGLLATLWLAIWWAVAKP